MELQELTEQEMVEIDGGYATAKKAEKKIKK